MGNGLQREEEILRARDALGLRRMVQGQGAAPRGESELVAVSAPPDGEAWAVGTSFTEDRQRTATIHHACPLAN